MDMLDLYSDYLIFQNKYATATGLSDLVDGAFAHDKVTRFLRLENFDSKSLILATTAITRKLPPCVLKLSVGVLLIPWDFLIRTCMILKHSIAS